MTEEQRNNPLHGVKLEALLTELVDHYGWEDLHTAININCFKSNPSIKSSLKFLRKTDWAREKVEGFYLYKYKRLPKPADDQYELPPRDRVIPGEHTPSKPMAVKPKSVKPTPANSVTEKRPPAADKKKSDVEVSSKKDSATVNDVWANWRNKKP